MSLHGTYGQKVGKIHPIIDRSLVFLIDTDCVIPMTVSNTKWIDLSIYQNHGTITSGTYMLDSNRGYMRFNGGVGTFSIPPHLKFGSDNFTISCWYLKVANGNPWQRIWNTGASATTSQWCFVGGYNGDNKFNFYKAYTFPGIVSNTTIRLNTWYFLTITRIKDTFSLFVNNQFDKSYTLAQSFNTTDSTFRINNSAAGESGNCKIGKLMMYNRALDISEIERNYMADMARFNYK